MAFISLPSGKPKQSPPKAKYYTIVGRIPEGENVCVPVPAPSAPDAVTRFINLLWKDSTRLDPTDPTSRESTIRRHGTDHYIDFIITTSERPLIHRP